MEPKPSFNNVEDTTSEAAQVDTSAAEEQENQIETMFQKHSLYDANYDSDYDEIVDNCVAIISDSDIIREVEPFHVDIRIGNAETKALVDSGSICTIINRRPANAVVLNCQEGFWVRSPEMFELKYYSNELIKLVGVYNT